MCHDLAFDTVPRHCASPLTPQSPTPHSQPDFPRQHPRNPHENPRPLSLGLTNDRRPPRVRIVANPRVERHIPQPVQPEPLALAACAVGAKDVRGRRAVRADENGHVLQQAEEGRLCLAEEGDAL